MRRVSSILALLWLASSCATGPQQTGTAALAPREGTAWQAALAEDTRRDQAWDWTIRQADLRATLVTPKLRKAFLDSRGEFQGRFTQDLEQELVAMGNPDPGVDVESRPAPESEEQVLVFVAFYATDQKNRDIGASYTIWDTTLERGDARAKPIQIESLKISPAVTAAFPYVDRFDEVYLVRFPLTDSSGRAFLSPGNDPLRLHIQSALADTAVEWTLTE